MSVCTRGVAAAVLGLMMAACSDSGTTNVSTNGQANVFMTSTAGSSGTLASEQPAYSTEQDRISSSAIDSIMVTVTSVQLLQAGKDTASDASWTTLALTNSGGVRINLLRLATDSIPVAQGSLAAGTYTNLRLNYDTATARITLKQAQVVGNAIFTAATSYPLKISSGAQTGIKIPVSVVVPAGGTGVITVVFDANTSLGTVVATGAGRLQMSSAFTARTSTL
jgi:hypothetical protein